MLKLITHAGSGSPFNYAVTGLQLTGSVPAAMMVVTSPFLLRAARSVLHTLKG